MCACLDSNNCSDFDVVSLVFRAVLCLLCLFAIVQCVLVVKRLCGICDTSCLTAGLLLVI